MGFLFILFEEPELDFHINLDLEAGSGQDD